MSSSTLPVGPEVLGIELGADATVSDGWLVRELHAPAGLDGPPGILQGGFAAGIPIAIARAADRFGAPVTSVAARLHAPTPLGRRLQAAVRMSDAAARHEVQIRHAETLCVSAEVELAGHDSSPQIFDLLELATVPLPEAQPQYDYPQCWVCGAEPPHPHAQRLHPRPHGPTSQVVPWVADDVLGDEGGWIDPVVVSAVLDCPTAWAAMDHAHASGYEVLLLGGFHLRFFRDAPVMEALRTVARMDEADGRKMQARAALVDEEGVTYAVASALQVGAAGLPPPTLGPR